MCVYGSVGAGRCIPLKMLVDVCQCGRLVMFVCLRLFETLFLSQNFVNKESESESGRC